MQMYFDIVSKRVFWYCLITIGSSYYECQYKMYRNKLNSLLKCAEKQYIADLLQMFLRWMSGVSFIKIRL